MDEALAIYQEFLDETGDALIAGDAETFLRRIHLPHVIETETDIIDVMDMNTARRHFEGSSSALRSQGADSYVRIARSVVFDGADRIFGRHVAIITSAGKLVAPRFENEMTLERRDGRWGILKTRHFARFVSWPDILPRETP